LAVVIFDRKKFGMEQFELSFLIQWSRLSAVSRILKTNLSWSPTWAKFCQLIISLSVILPQYYLTKL